MRTWHRLLTMTLQEQKHKENWYILISESFECAVIPIQGKQQRYCVAVQLMVSLLIHMLHKAWSPTACTFFSLSGKLDLVIVSQTEKHHQKGNGILELSNMSKKRLPKVFQQMAGPLESLCSIRKSLLSLTGMIFCFVKT